MPITAMLTHGISIDQVSGRDASARIDSPAHTPPQTAVGLPLPQDTDQATDLHLLAQPGYAFKPGVEGPRVAATPGPKGAHGYFNTDSDMQALFIASGAYIKPGTQLGPISNLRVAPTLAHGSDVDLLGAKQPILQNGLQSSHSGEE